MYAKKKIEGQQVDKGTAGICGTSTLVTYYLNFIARQDICAKCLKCRKTLLACWKGPLKV